MTFAGSPLSRSLFGAKRTSLFAAHMSAFDPKRTFRLNRPVLSPTINLVPVDWGNSYADARVERRLAAILAADSAGYSRLMGLDEEGTLAALKTVRRTLFDPKIEEHRGRIVKTTGDGALVEFPSAVDAVRCAVDIQRGLSERNNHIPDGRRIELRIGI